MISVNIVADSIAQNGVRLTTYSLRYPRVIHSEFNTHRMFSRNASSSRAIPTKTLIQQVMDEPFMPTYWGKNQKGMQAKTELSPDLISGAKRTWLDGRDHAAKIASTLSDMGVHKQLVNRVIEPWSHISVVVTATEWENFFNLRTHEDAQPEMQELANKMKRAMMDHAPEKMAQHHWHLPYITMEDYKYADTLEHRENSLLKWSVARCCRVSYLKHGTDKLDYAEDEKLYHDLLNSGHMSPFEHQAQPMTSADTFYGNFRGWMQYRKTLANEAVWRR